MSNRHKVFVSYHHTNDLKYRESFEKRFANTYDIMVSKSVEIGDIDPDTNEDDVRRIIREEYLQDSTVTVVLIGAETWKRKHVDWEIGASLRHTKANPRSGLIGIFLPTHPDFGKDKYNPCLIPPRLYFNVKCGFAKLYDWSNSPNKVQSWIHEAFRRRNEIDPDNSHPSFKRNYSGKGWC